MVEASNTFPLFPVDSDSLQHFLTAPSDELRDLRVGTLVRGDIVPDSTGTLRLIINVGGGAVVFIMNDGAYLQDARGFSAEVWLYRFSYAGGVLQPTLHLIELEMAFLTGVLTTVSPAVFWTDRGITIVQFAQKLKRIWPQLALGYTIVTEARRLLKQYAPTFYTCLVRMAAAQIVERMPENVSGIDLASALGTLIASLVKMRYTARANLLILSVKSVLAALKAVLTVVVKSAIHATNDIAGDVKIAVETVQKVFGTRRVVLTQEEALAILREYSQASAAIDTILVDLERGLVKLNVAFE